MVYPIPVYSFIISSYICICCSRFCSCPSSDNGWVHSKSVLLQLLFIIFCLQNIPYISFFCCNVSLSLISFRGISIIFSQWPVSKPFYLFSLSIARPFLSFTSISITYWFVPKALCPIFNLFFNLTFKLFIS